MRDFRPDDVSPLSDEAVELLTSALASEGLGIAGDAARLTGLLKDSARGRLDREIDALVTAVKTGVVAELLERRAHGGRLDAAHNARLTDLLAERLSLGDSRWAVTAWRAALGFSTIAAARPSPVAEPKREAHLSAEGRSTLQASLKAEPKPLPWRSLTVGALVMILIAAGLTPAHHWFATMPSRALAAIEPQVKNEAAALAFPAREALASTASPTGALAFCGSNTIGSQLGPDFARAFLSSLGAQAPSVRTTRTDETDVAGRDLSIPIAAHGSATAFAGLRSGVCQIGMASRAIKDREVESLRPLGNMRSPTAEHVIGLDGIAVIVNAANPVSTLSMQQLADVFTGHTKTWNALGGGSGRISIMARDDNSGTWDTFKTLVLNSTPLAPWARRFEDSATLSSAVAADPNAIGFIGLPYVNQAKALRIASGATPVAPTVLTVGRETYPLSRRLFLYTAAAPRDPLIGRFISFVESDAGQRIVNRDGFVGTVTSLATSKSSSRTLPSAAPARYRALVDSYDQTSFNFYFNTGSDELDNKALVDVGRLLSLLSVAANRNKSVVLAGFADSTGDPASNAHLSELRARAAARELRAQGIRVKDTAGFGQQLPIRDNATIQGREKNRRVEIFLTR